MLIGAEGRYEGLLEVEDWEVIRTARLEAIKVSTLQDFRNLFVVYHPPTDLEYARKIQEAYKKGIRYFVLHQYPNHIDYGYEKWWRTGKAFSEWWVDNALQLKKVFPDAKIGVPAMKPGGDNELIQADSWQFFSECGRALMVSDFYELECAWNGWYEMRQQLCRVDSYCDRYEKPIAVTFYNCNSNVPKKEKAEQYVKFCEELKRHDKVFVAFVRRISSPKGTDRFYVLRGEQVGAPSVIAERMADLSASHLV